MLAADEAATGEVKTEGAPVPGPLLPSSAAGEANTCSRGACYLSR